MSLRWVLNNYKIITLSTKGNGTECVRVKDGVAEGGQELKGKGLTERLVSLYRSVSLSALMSSSFSHISQVLPLSLGLLQMLSHLLENKDHFYQAHVPDTLP